MDTSFGFKENIAEDEDSEVSGWTSYFDDFFAKQRKEECSGGRISNDGCLVSDAASFVDDQKKFSKTGRLIPSTSTLTKLSKTLDVKKRNKENLYDDSLEDTASSPVNSPKVMQVEGGIPDIRLDGNSDDEKTVGRVMEGEKNDCRALKKPGLCLFSMSMTGSYFV